MNQEPVLSRAAVVALYTRLIEAWNRRDAAGYAAQFAGQGSTVGFDGSQMDGRAAIATELGRIFRDHTPATYVARVREVHTIAPGVVLLRAVAGMLPPKESAIKPELNTIQSLLAVAEGASARVVHFQNTPARFHGRPELVQRLTSELQSIATAGRVVDAVLK